MTDAGSGQLEGQNGAEFRRLAWRSRRGLLELDLILERFLAQYKDGLTGEEIAAYQRLLDLPDPELLDLVNNKSALSDTQMLAIVEKLRAL